MSRTLTYAVVIEGDDPAYVTYLLLGNHLSRRAASPEVLVKFLVADGVKEFDARTFVQALVFWDPMRERRFERTFELE